MMRRSPVSSLIGWVTLFRKSYRLLLGMVSPEELHLLSSLQGGSPYTLFLVRCCFIEGWVKEYGFEWVESGGV